MPETFKPYLCGGVLYFLLAQTKKSKSSAKDHRNGIKDDHSDPIMMGDLLYAFTGSKDYGKTKRDVSEYRECQKEGSINVPFNDPTFSSAYNSTVTSRYPEALSRMYDFVSWHIHPQKYEWLVKALLDIIEHDDTILDTDPFYISPDGLPVTKATIRRTDSFLIQPFLVGVLHFITATRIGCNHLGITTLEEWGEKTERRERRYTGNAGDGITRIIHVASYKPAEEEPSTLDPLPEDTQGDTLENSQKNNAPQDEPKERETEYIEGEVVDGEASSGAEGTNSSGEPKGHNTIIQHQTNVIQNGENNYQFTNNGTVVFDFRKGK